MKKIITTIALVLLLSACGDETNTASMSNDKKAAAKSSEKIIACELLTQNYIQKTFTGAATIVKKDSSVPKSREAQHCAYSFQLDNQDYNVSLNLLAANDPYADEKVLDMKVSYISGSELISGVGEKAYYSSGTLTALGSNSIVQITTYSTTASKENDKSRGIAEKVANGMLKALNK